MVIVKRSLAAATRSGPGKQKAAPRFEDHELAS